MIKQVWKDGILIGSTEIPDPPPDPARVALDKAIADTDKAVTVADLKVIVKKILSLMACVAVVFLVGCGMFGDTRLYTGILNLCAKCHADNPTAPAGMDNLKRSAPGAEGVGGTSAKCKFTMDHWTRKEGAKP
jgi:hypothetical protein